MGDGRTDLFRSMWTKTTTNDVKKTNWKYSDTTVRKIDANSIYDLEHMPDQRMHKIVSFVKSGLRLVACIFGMTQMYVVAFALLFMAEVVGIYEEMV